ncbi:MAG: outer membrane beta-barrel protein [Bacteroidetes bacterium]|nr:outer membrane beta-barrel protein [Bacteroidota bacterium]MBK8682197.1 outer membrane beta-barrel protein [Bacteroidota bacterium]
MKKIVLLLIVIAGSFLSSQLYSQTNLGVRLGGWNGYGAEVSYQGPIGSGNRLEADLGIRSGNGYSGFSLVGIYQWTFALEDGFGWYVGPGASLGVWSYDDVSSDDDGFFLGVNGQIGLEYNFTFPIQLSIDYRPGISITGGGWFNDFGFGIRWRFGG